MYNGQPSTHNFGQRARAAAKQHTPVEEMAARTLEETGLQDFAVSNEQEAITGLLVRAQDDHQRIQGECFS